MMKKILPLLFALSIATGPAFAWGGGDCQYSKEEANKEVPNENIEKTESAKKK